MIVPHVDIQPILLNMFIEQVDHQYATFGEIYSKYRRAVTGWMMEISDYFNLHPTTTHAAIAYLDRLQPNDRFSRNEWQMLAIACILISSKYNESEEHVPSRCVLEEITEQRISNKVILGFEIWILMKMSWKLSAFTPMSFLACYMSEGVTFFTDRCTKYHILTERTDAINANILKMANTLMLEDSLKHHHASDIACAIVYIAREEMNIVPVWRRELTTLMRGLDPCNPLLAKLIRTITRILSSQPSEPATDSISPASTPRNNENLLSPEGKENIKYGHTSPVSVADLLESTHALR